MTDATITREVGNDGLVDGPAGEGRRHLDLGSLPLLPALNRPWVVITNGKGGDGKTTSVLQLSSFAQYLGHRVLLVDLDYRQKSLSQWRNSRVAAWPLVETCTPDGLDKILLTARQRRFDLVVVDTPAALDAQAPKIFAHADLTLVFTRAGSFDVSVALRRARWLSDLGCDFGVVLTATPPLRLGVESPLVASARASLESVQRHLWPGQITHRHSVISATARGSTVLERDPSDPAVQEYASLWRSVVRTLQRKATNGTKQE